MPKKSSKTASHTPTWTKADSLRAFNEGWGIFITTQAGRLIQRIDINPTFSSDVDAMNNVLARAIYARSRFHAKALTIILRDHL